jgi:hypothetical protein
MTTITGQVTGIAIDRSGQQERLRLEVTTGDGRTIAVDGGLWAADDTGKPQLERGDQVTIEGLAWTNRGGETNVTARTIRRGDQRFEVKSEEQLR